jgi:hypothetical protein
LKSSHGSLSNPKIDKIFSQVQMTREKRVKKLVIDAHLQQRLEALESPWEKFNALILLPVADTDDVMFNASCNIPLSEKLDMIDLPPRPKLIPFKDELATAPKPRGIYGWLQVATYLAWAGAAYYGMWLRPSKYGLAEHFVSTLTTGVFPEMPVGFPLKRTYTGISVFDNTLTFLDTAFMSGIAGWHKGFWMLQVYFLGLLLQPIAIWAIESCRKRNAMSLLSL